MMRGAILVLGCALPALAAVEFNRDIRPILSDKCFACHGPDKGNRKSKLRLDIESDSRADLGGGRRGIAPGDPARSEIYKRIVATNALRMPPQWAGHAPLPARDIELIKRWIEEGGAYQKHWSLLPPRRTAAPPVRDAASLNPAWIRNPIDGYVLARLEREGLKPSSEARPETLLRRVTLDLTGLPPTPEEAAAFAADTRPDAYDRAVDRLLGSPRYAERMAIRWLEAARYSDTNGYQTDGPRDMWRWRDWVIGAFHANMPFDRFTVEQIAGDLLPNATLDQKIATGFHRNHRTTAEGGIVDEEFRVEYIADRAETTGSVFLGLTVGCARCHDHKYDPITQKDFYSLFAFYNNTPEKGFVYNFGNEEPYIQAPLPDQQAKLDGFDRRIAEARARVQALEPGLRKAQANWEKKLAKQREPFEWALNDGLVFHAALDCDDTLPHAPGRVKQAIRFDGRGAVEFESDNARFNYRDPYTFAAWIKPETNKGAIFSRNEDYFEGQGYALYLIDGKLRFHYTYRWTDLGMRVESAAPVKIGQWTHVALSYDASMKASHVKMYVDGRPVETNVLFDSNVWPLDAKAPVRVGAGGGLRFNGLIDDVRAYNRVLTPEEVATLPLTGPLNAIAALRQRTPAQANKLRYAFLDGLAPAPVLQARAELAAIEKERAKFSSTVPTVMVMSELPGRRDTFVLKRGAYDAPGEKVEPAVPAALPPLKPEWPRNRFGLAKWLVDRENPLTARVTVNRFWQMFFGTGLVKTVEDFGSQGEWPVHPELLDWLAVEFMETGWDMKRLVRTIVTSAAYRQASTVTPELLAKDPENRLLARGPRYRLPAEMIRDQALAVSGLLVEKVGGPSVRPYQPPGLWQELHGGKGYEPDKGEGLWRRSLYTYWKRTVAPPSMINFDSPTREVCVVRESRTNTPLQALNLMNDVAYVEAARKLAERMIAAGGVEPGWRLALGRAPNPKEAAVLESALSRFRAYYKAHPADAETFLKQGDAPRDAAIAPAELAAYTGVASLIFNLDEMVTKE